MECSRRFVSKNGIWSVFPKLDHHPITSVTNIPVFCISAIFKLSHIWNGRFVCIIQSSTSSTICRSTNDLSSGCQEQWSRIPDRKHEAMIRSLTCISFNVKDMLRRQSWFFHNEKTKCIWIQDCIRYLPLNIHHLKLLLIVIRLCIKDICWRCFAILFRQFAAACFWVLEKLHSDLNWQDLQVYDRVIIYNCL